MINFGDDKIFIENYEKLKSSRKMGELYGCDKKSITSHAKKIGYDYSKNKEIKITKYPIEQIIADYENLCSSEKVGKKYGCSSTAVLNYLKNKGYTPKNFNTKLTGISDQEFIATYEKLGSAKSVGEKYGCTNTAVLNHAHKIGYFPGANKTYKLSEENKKEILLAYDSNITATELAEKFQVSRGMITKLWHDNGLFGKENKGGENTALDLQGQRFGKWLVLEKTSKRNAGGAVYWKCRCDCGIEREVLGTSLVQGLTMSCGNHNNISKGNEKIV